MKKKISPVFIELWFIFLLPSIVIIIFSKQIEIIIFTYSILLLILLLILLILKYFGSKKISTTWLLKIKILIFSFLISILGAWKVLEIKPHFPVNSNEVEKLKIKIITDPKIKDGKIVTRIKLLSSFFKQGEGTTSGIFTSIIKIEDNSLDINYGDILLIDKIRYQKEQNLLFGSFVKIIGNENNLINDVRVLCRRKLNSVALESGEWGGVVLALIDGDRSLVDEAISRKYRSAGVSHLLALSGMHLGLIVVMIFMIVEPLFGRKIAIIFTVIISIIYCWFAGASASLVRATLMIFIGFFFKISGNKISIKLILSLSLSISIIIQPWAINSAGFILSYLALFGIVIFQPIIESSLSLYINKKISSILSVAIAAQLSTSIWIINNFNYISTGGLFASIILTPITFLLMGLGAIGLFLKTISFDFLFDLISLMLSFLYKTNNIVLIYSSELPVINNYFMLFVYYCPLLILIIISTLSNKKSY